MSYRFMGAARLELKILAARAVFGFSGYNSVRTGRHHLDVYDGPASMASSHIGMLTAYDDGTASFLQFKADEKIPALVRKLGLEVEDFTRLK